MSLRSRNLRAGFVNGFVGEINKERARKQATADRIAELNATQEREIAKTEYLAEKAKLEKHRQDKLQGRLREGGGFTEAYAIAQLSTEQKDQREVLENTKVKDDPKGRSQWDMLVEAKMNEGRYSGGSSEEEMTKNFNSRVSKINTTAQSQDIRTDWDRLGGRIITKGVDTVAEGVGLVKDKVSGAYNKITEDIPDTKAPAEVPVIEQGIRRDPLTGLDAPVVAQGPLTASPATFDGGPELTGDLGTDMASGLPQASSGPLGTASSEPVLPEALAPQATGETLVPTPLTQTTPQDSFVPASEVYQGAVRRPAEDPVHSVETSVDDKGKTTYTLITKGGKSSVVEGPKGKVTKSDFINGVKNISTTVNPLEGTGLVEVVSVGITEDGFPVNKLYQIPGSMVERTRNKKPGDTFDIEATINGKERKLTYKINEDGKGWTEIGNVQRGFGGQQTPRKVGDYNSVLDSEKNRQEMVIRNRALTGLSALREASNEAQGNAVDWLQGKGRSFIDSAMANFPQFEKGKGAEVVAYLSGQVEGDLSTGFKEAVRGQVVSLEETRAAFALARTLMGSGSRLTGQMLEMAMEVVRPGVIRGGVTQQAAVSTLINSYRGEARRQLSGLTIQHNRDLLSQNDDVRENAEQQQGYYFSSLDGVENTLFRLGDRMDKPTKTLITSMFKKLAEAKKPFQDSQGRLITLNVRKQGNQWQITDVLLGNEEAENEDRL